MLTSASERTKDSTVFYLLSPGVHWEMKEKKGSCRGNEREITCAQMTHSRTKAAEELKDAGRCPCTLRKIANSFR